MTVDRYRRVLGEVSFLRFWLGFTASVLGDGMTRVALTWFVYETTGSARDVGWLMLCYTGPVLIGGLMAGSLLDRFDRRRVMIADNLVRGAAVAAVPILHALGHLELWHVYVVAGIYGLLMMLSLAGGPALVPSLVRDEELPTANALEMLSFTLGGIVGPPLAGILIGAVGAPNVVIVDAVSYGLFALALCTIRPVVAAQRDGAARSGGLGEAVRLLWGSPILLTTTVMFMAFNIGSGLLLVWLPVLVDRRLDGGAGLYGILLGILAVGEVLSSLLAGALVLPYALGRLICLAQAASGTVLLLLIPTSIPLAGLGLLLYGAASAPLTIWAQTLRMRIIPEHLRGRSFALLRTLMQGGAPIGGALGGLLLPLTSISAMIALSVGVIAGPGLLGLRVSELRVAGASARPSGAGATIALMNEQPGQ